MNFKKLYRLTCIFFLIMFFQGNAFAATIHGTVYEWESFKPLDNAVVEINSTPEQNFVATNANYSFNLTPGTYLITANYFEGKTIVYTAKEEVVISDKGEYVHDLLLFPTYNEELLNHSRFEVPNLSFDETKHADQNNSQNYFFVSVFLAFILILLLAGYFIKKRYLKPLVITNSFPDGGREPKTLQPESAIDEEENLDDTFEISSKLSTTNSVDVEDLQEDREINLPEDLKELLNLIRTNGNRITQRENSGKNLLTQNPKSALCFQTLKNAA